MPNLNELLTTNQQKRLVIAKVMATFSSLGFIQVDPDYTESLRSFSNLNPSIDESKLVKFTLPDGNLYTLRPDITSSLLQQFIPNMQASDQAKLSYASTYFRQSAAGLSIASQIGFETYGQVPIKQRYQPLFTLLSLLKQPTKLVISYPSLVLDWVDKRTLSISEKKRLIATIRMKAVETIPSFSLSTEEQTYLQLILQTLYTVQTLPSWARSAFNQEEFTIFNQQAMVFDLSGLAQYDYYSGVYIEGYMPGYARPVVMGGTYDKRTEVYGKSIQAFGLSFDMDMLIREVNV
jgi:ATP phosphoribosyltransferase regulatory subunit